MDPDPTARRAELDRITAENDAIDRRRSRRGWWPLLAALALLALSAAAVIADCF